MQCPRCNAQIEDDTAFCGNCGQQIVPVQAPGATVASSLEGVQPRTNRSTPAGDDRTTPLSMLQRFSPPVPPYAPAPGIPARGETPVPPSKSRARFTNPRRITLIVALVLIVIAAGTVGLLAVLQHNNGTGNKVAVGANIVAQAAFIDSPNGTPGHTDALTISAQGLNAAPAGFQYNAWLVDDKSEHIVALGSLKSSGQTFSLSYAGDGSNGQPGTNLLGIGNKLEITLEQGVVQSPVGQVVLAGTFPPQAFVHIKHLLFSFPSTPGKIGLLVGLRDQTQHLNEQALVLQNIAASHNSFAIQCAAQSILDIIDGTAGSHYQPLPQGCNAQNITEMGDGFGILGSNGYVATAATHASLAASRPDATGNIKLHAGHVEIAMTNIKGWVTTVEQDALNLLNAPGNVTKLQEIVTLSDQAFHGVDINGDEHIDPVPGEAGAITGYQHGQLMATLPLVPGA